MRKKTNSKYICMNCGATITKAEIKGYFKNGFSLHHIACPECGEHCLCARECTVPCPICGKPILEEREFCSRECKDKSAHN